ncbi:MAG TPA: DNA translocase FtsK, partial [Paraburkholderia sp.]
MHTVVLGWFGASAVWFLPLVWRLVRSVLPGGAARRGPGSIRLWLGFAGVLVASCALEGTLVHIDGFNAFGQFLSGALTKLGGRVAPPVAMTVLLAAALPWLLDFGWRDFFAWADLSLGLGLGIQPGRGDDAPRRRDDTPRRSRRAQAADAAPPPGVLPTIGMPPRQGERRTRPTVWRPPAPTRRAGTAAGVGGGAVAASQSARAAQSGRVTWRAEPGFGTARAGGFPESLATVKPPSRLAERPAEPMPSPARASKPMSPMPPLHAASSAVAAAAVTSQHGFAAPAAAQSLPAGGSARGRGGPPPVAGSTAARAAANAPVNRPRMAPRPYVWAPNRPATPADTQADVGAAPPASHSTSATPALAPDVEAAPVSEDVAATLRTIEENAASWTALANASLARQRALRAEEAQGAADATAPAPTVAENTAQASPLAPPELSGNPQPQAATPPVETVPPAPASDQPVAVPFAEAVEPTMTTHAPWEAQPHAPLAENEPSTANNVAVDAPVTPTPGEPVQPVPSVPAAPPPPDTFAPTPIEPDASAPDEAPAPLAEPAERPMVRGHAPTNFEFRPPAASAVDLPGLDLLERASTDIEPVSEEKLAQTGQLIEQRLQEFKVPVTVVGASAGPVITRFEIEPALGVRGSQIVGLMKDLSRGLGLTSIRVVETIPGKTCMGLELPNARRQMIRLSEILESGPYHRSASKLTIAMGKDIIGQPVVTDLAKAPHMLVAGTTGSGKSVAINAMILSLLYKATPEDVRLIMIDPKMLELSVYEGIPHLLAPVVTDMKLAANALNWCVGE